MVDNKIITAEANRQEKELLTWIFKKQREGEIKISFGVGIELMEKWIKVRET